MDVPEMSLYVLKTFFIVRPYGIAAVHVESAVALSEA
jgi:hypothetical protein